ASDALTDDSTRRVSLNKKAAQTGKAKGKRPKAKIKIEDGADAPFSSFTSAFLPLAFGLPCQQFAARLRRERPCLTRAQTRPYIRFLSAAS
ncbi:MAG TPA: hypothetical protein VE821_09115, partial [Pyrinomonadaceae bacterium]|nr:hypothetical protein [Pyrinomonadaceae bacterium]